MSVSILILTLNEARNLPGCLQALSDFDDIHVADSMSVDETATIARSLGATVHFRTFDNWADHQNAMLATIPFSYPWVAMVDADERMTPELAREIFSAVTDPKGRVAILLRRRDHFLGKPITHAQPADYLLRLFRRDSIRFERLVNPAPVVAGPVGVLHGFLDHNPFSHGVLHWARRHNDYSRLEAMETIRRGNLQGMIADALRRPSPQRSRRLLKELYQRLPAKPAWRFLYLYLLKGGFRDRLPGLLYSLFQSTYQSWIDLKRIERIDKTNQAIRK